MLMSDFEIVRDYKAAAKKGKQIGILADMNGCSREKIREVLRRNGISEAELPGKPGRKPTAEETEIFKPAKKSYTKPEEFRSGKQEPAEEQTKEPEETVVSKTVEEMLSMEETSEPEPVHVVATEVRHEVPESVKKACRDRIWGIIQEVAELEREKRELQGFLGESA